MPEGGGGGGSDAWGFEVVDVAADEAFDGEADGFPVGGDGGLGDGGGGLVDFGAAVCMGSLYGASPFGLIFPDEINPKELTPLTVV